MACGDKTAKYKYARINISTHLATLAQIVRDPIARKHEERQLDLLGEVFLTTPYAYWLWDLPNVTIVIEYLLEKVKENVNFKQHLLNFLELFSVPPMLCRSNDVLNGLTNLQEYFSFFGYILVIAEDVEYKKLVIEALWKILLRKHKLLNRCATLKFCHEALESSNLPEMLANLLEITEEDLYEQLLGIICEIAKISNTTCVKMLQQGILKTVLTKLYPNHKAHPPVFVEFHTLPEEPKNVDITLELAERCLKTLEDFSVDERKTQFPLGVKPLHGLRYTLRVEVLGTRKTRRNYLFSLILKIMDLFPEELMLQSGLLADIALLAAGSEMGTAGTWAHNLKFGVDREDFELKRMLLTNVYYYSKSLGGDYFVRETCIILAMLKIIAPEYKSKWCPDHACALKYYTLTILERLLPEFLQEFLDNKGLLRIAMLVDFYKHHKYDPSILIAALKLIKEVLKTQHDQAMMFYCVEIRLCREIQGLISHILKKERLNSQNQEAIQYGLDILNILTLSMEISLFNTVELILKIFDRALQPDKDDMPYDVKMMVSAVSCLNTLCVSNDDFATAVCDEDGVFMLLDLLKDAEFPLKIVGLGLLVVLSEEGGVLPYLLTWRGEGATFQQLLLGIFREENELLGVQIESDGIVKDYLHPLMGKCQRSQMNKLTDPKSSPSITDLDCSCRPKIYALIKLLEVRFADKTDIANDYYKIYTSNLTLEDRVTKIMVDNYLCLKMAETWLEVSVLQKNSDFIPVPADLDMIQIMLKVSAKWCENMYNLQMDLKKSQHKNEIISEQDFYHLLRESKLADALEALKEICVMARSTEVLFQLTGRMREVTTCDDPSIHRTLNPDIGLSWIKNQKISLVSDKNDLDVESLPLVSPIPETVELLKIPSMANSTISFDINYDCKEGS